jgi:hypothetical protein
MSKSTATAKQLIDLYERMCALDPALHITVNIHGAEHLTMPGGLEYTHYGPDRPGAIASDEFETFAYKPSRRIGDVTFFKQIKQRLS